ncbi:MAG: S1-like domain-containing RNA-binding protein [Sphingobacteriales bacterium]|nr:S1-like domain-containing RNA-binding protein [Sphingobacteriales bacterium]
MINVGTYNQMKVLRAVEFGVYLDDGNEGILLPKRFVPAGLKPGDEINVFIYHDGDERLIATTQKPKGILGDIVKLAVVSTNAQGAFLDWGLMKDIFVPISQQQQKMIPKGEYLVKIVLDEQTGRIAATERIERFLSNENVVIINNVHTGVLHHNEIYRNITSGDAFKGFIKKIHPKDNKIDVAVGKSGYKRVEDETSKILRLLNDHNGFLPYNDKSNPDDIYDVFEMSKKTFKMTIGNLYKKRIINFEEKGIRLIKES